MTGVDLSSSRTVSNNSETIATPFRRRRAMVAKHSLVANTAATTVAWSETAIRSTDKADG